MTDTIERKALALRNEVAAENGDETYHWWDGWRECNTETEALCRAIEQYEAFRQEVSDAVESVVWQARNLRVGNSYRDRAETLTRFIIAKPDPLVEVMQEWWDTDGYASIETFRAALAARGLEITEKKQ